MYVPLPLRGGKKKFRVGREEDASVGSKHPRIKPFKPKQGVTRKTMFNKTAGKHYANVKLMRRGGGRETGINQTLNQISRRIIAKLLLTCSTQFCSRYGQE